MESAPLALQQVIPSAIETEFNTLYMCGDCSYIKAKGKWQSRKVGIEVIENFLNNRPSV